jgi:hypothetical protein
MKFGTSLGPSKIPFLKAMTQNDSNGILFYIHLVRRTGNTYISSLLLTESFVTM